MAANWNMNFYKALWEGVKKDILAREKGQLFHFQCLWCQILLYCYSAKQLKTRLHVDALNNNNKFMQTIFFFLEIQALEVSRCTNKFLFSWHFSFEHNYFPFQNIFHACSQGSIHVTFNSLSFMKILIYNYTHQVCQGNDFVLILPDL